MRKVDPKTLNFMAQSLLCGENVYYNVKTGETIELPADSEMWDEPEIVELWQGVFDKIENDKMSLIEICPLTSHDSFKIMEDFAAQVPDNNFIHKLENTLRRSKPFRNFKELIDDSEYRQSWFDFQEAEYEKIVVKELANNKPGDFELPDF
jgi:hypothetical protein